jgi:HAD superfamily hydrolase (TIGR01509 family)
MPSPNAVIFDNDGLLLDTETVWSRAEADLFARRGLEFTLEHKHEVVGTSAQVAGALFERQLGEPGRAAQIVAELDELVFSELEKGIEPMVGALDLVAALREREVPIAIASNSPARFITRALELVGLDEAFAVQVSGHEVPAPKPAPDVYLAACEHLGVTADRAVVVLEDSPTGVASGIAAGLTVIGVPSLPGVELDAAHHLHGSLADAKLRARLGLPTG